MSYGLNQCLLDLRLGFLTWWIRFEVIEIMGLREFWVLGDFGWRPRRRMWRGSPDRTREVTKVEEREVFGEKGRFVCFTFYFWRKFIFNFTTIGVSRLDGIDYYLLLHIQENTNYCLVKLQF